MAHVVKSVMFNIVAESVIAELLGTIAEATVITALCVI